jgi:type IV secretion system protein VirD4
MSHAHQHPFGSARFEDSREVLRAFRHNGGVPFAFLRGRKLHHAKRAGMLLVGGAGSGKFTSVLAHIMGSQGRSGEPLRYAIFDPKRENREVLEPWLAQIGAAVYEFNPYGTHGKKGLRLSLMSHLVPRSMTLVADCRRAARTFTPESGGGDSRFFEQKAQNWLDPLIRGLVHADGGVSPLSLFDLVGMIRSAPEVWAQMASAMAALGEPDLRVAYDEMIEMAEQSRRTFDSVMSEITNALAFMSDPLLQGALVSTDQANFTLDVLCEESTRPVFVFFVIPPELTEQSAPLIRQFFSTLRTLKQRKPSAPTVNLVIDEAAQLGRFPELAEFYSIGRGFGLSPLCIYQDIGQIKRNLGPTGATTISASADLEVYLGGGISDLETAEHLSRKLGNQTLALDDDLTRERAARAKREAIHAILSGKADPVRTGLAMRSLDYEMTHVRRQARALRTPDEILTMPHNQALVLASGYGLHPFLADKRPYYACRQYAGFYGPNPYFDRDLSRVTVQTFWGKRTRRVICEPVPPEFAHLPQYADGQWRFIEGYRPTIKRKGGIAP